MCYPHAKGEGYTEYNTSRLRSLQPQHDKIIWLVNGHYVLKHIACKHPLCFCESVTDHVCAAEKAPCPVSIKSSGKGMNQWTKEPEGLLREKESSLVPGLQNKSYGNLT